MKDAFDRRNPTVTKHFRGAITKYNENFQNLTADGYTVRVFLDGRERPAWTEADSDQGTVTIAYSLTLKGDVEIRLERAHVAV